MEYLSKMGFTISHMLWVKLISSVLIIILIYLINWITSRMVKRRISDPKTRFSAGKTIDYLSVAIGAILVGRLWFEGVQSLATYLGLVSAGLAISLKDIFVNLAGWIFILWRKPFALGNRIQIDSFSGDVIDIRPFQFTILEIGNWVNADQSTGRMIHIPNGIIFNSPISNYDSGFQYIWNEIPVLITFESDWQEAKKILQEIISVSALTTIQKAEKEIIESSKKFLIFYNNLSPKVYTSVEDSGILLTLRYLTQIRERRDGAENIWEQILIQFSEHSDINLAYPTYRRV